VSRRRTSQSSLYFSKLLLFNNLHEETNGSWPAFPSPGGCGCNGTRDFQQHVCIPSKYPAEVLAGRFREDLFYRLSSIQIRVPSLTERLEDIPLLVHYFLKKYNEVYGKNISGLTRRAQTVLLQHAWPGNVRELENVIATAAITATGDFIDLADLPEHLQHRGPRRPEGEDWRPLALDKVCKLHIQRVLELCQGNRLRAAQILGIGRTSLYRYLKRDGHEMRAREKSGGAAA
jgi:transcriptional regulator with PAS, ATPase and Fis domain